jgi:hypothetical protein
VKVKGEVRGEKQTNIRAPCVYFMKEMEKEKEHEELLDSMHLYRYAIQRNTSFFFHLRILLCGVVVSAKVTAFFLVLSVSLPFLFW